MSPRYNLLVKIILLNLALKWSPACARGVTVKVDQTLPFMASILEGVLHYCTGVVLNSRTVLITAMCQDNISLKLVLAGVNECSASQNQTVPQVSFRFPHPTFNFHTLEGDIAVMHVKEHLKGRVKAAKLLNRNLQVGEKVGICGWEMSFMPSKSEKEIHKVTTTVIDPLSCTQHYGAQFNPTYMVCIDYYEMGNKTNKGCEMDPSAPVYVEEEETYFVAALSLFMPGCLFENWPGVYINLFPYRRWILRHMHPKGQ